MIVILFSAIGGGLLTGLTLLPHGILLAIVGAPLGGSFCGALAALLLASRPGADSLSQADLEEQADAMVAALRGVAAQAERTPSERRPAEAQPERKSAGSRAA